LNDAETHREKDGTSPVLSAEPDVYPHRDEHCGREESGDETSSEAGDHARAAARGKPGVHSPVDEGASRHSDDEANDRADLTKWHSSAPNESRLSGGRATRQPHNTCTISGQPSSQTTPRTARARPLQALVRLQSSRQREEMRQVA